MALLLPSIKVTWLAPLLKLSIPRPPVPPNKSNTLPSHSNILNKFSFILSVVGLVFIPSTEFNFIDLYFPAITLI